MLKDGSEVLLMIKTIAFPAPPPPLALKPAVLNFLWPCVFGELGGNLIGQLRAFPV